MNYSRRRGKTQEQKDNTMWWKSINLTFINQIIAYVNSAMTEELSPIDTCSDLFKALNKIWQQYNAINNLQDSDSKSIQNLLINTVNESFFDSTELNKFSLFSPKVMNHDTLRKFNYDPSNIPADLRKKAEDEHNQLFNAYKRYCENPTEESIAALSKKTAQLLYVVRSNIMHGEKTPNGPDINKIDRDNSICAIVGPILRKLISILFEGPDIRIALYGTLRPGQVNHNVISNIVGVWKKGTVNGRIEYKCGLPIFRWEINKDNVEVDVLISEDLLNEYSRLDRFEGTAYIRQWIPVHFDNGSLEICNMYCSKI